SVDGIAAAERPAHAADDWCDVTDSARGERAEVVLQRDDVAFAVRMDAIRKEDVERFGARIDPEESPGPSGVSVGADRKHLAARFAEARIEIESSRPPHRNIRRRLDGSHHVDDLGPEDRI